MKILTRRWWVAAAAVAVVASAVGAVVASAGAGAATAKPGGLTRRRIRHGRAPGRRGMRSCGHHGGEHPHGDGRRRGGGR